jgi:hypothetical protein
LTDQRLFGALEKIASGLVATVATVAALTVMHSHAQTTDRNLRISFRNNLLTISAEEADLKNVLLEVAEKTKIFISLPNSLEQKITTELTETPLPGALDRLLKGLNYAIIYSGAGTREAAIEEVFVLSKPQRSRRPSPRGNVRRITNRIKVYERQIESLKRHLSNIDQNSRRGKQYSRRIRSLEKNIERLEAKLN